jgi:hypothetical protein
MHRMCNRTAEASKGDEEDGRGEVDDKEDEEDREYETSETRWNARSLGSDEPQEGAPTGKHASSFGPSLAARLFDFSETCMPLSGWNRLRAPARGSASGDAPAMTSSLRVERRWRRRGDWEVVAIKLYKPPSQPEV